RGAGLPGAGRGRGRSAPGAGPGTYTGSRPWKSASARWLGCAPARDRPYSEASSEYCACVNPNGASTRSAAARHFIDARQTRYPGVAFAVSSVGTTTTTRVHVENPRPGRLPNVCWHMERDLAPLLFKDEPPPTPEARVARAGRSGPAEHKARRKRNHTARRSELPLAAG